MIRTQADSGNDSENDSINGEIRYGNGNTHDHERQESIRQRDIESLELISEIRTRIYNNTYKFPSFCRYFTPIFIMLWSILCAFISSLFCMCHYVV